MAAGTPGGPAAGRTVPDLEQIDGGTPQRRDPKECSLEIQGAEPVTPGAEPVPAGVDEGRRPPDEAGPHPFPDRVALNEFVEPVQCRLCRCPSACQPVAHPLDFAIEPARIVERDQALRDIKPAAAPENLRGAPGERQIGRASCRERVGQYV